VSKKPYVCPSIKRNSNSFLEKHCQGPVGEPCDRIDGTRIEELVAEHGSPLFVFSERQLREKYREAHLAFSTRYPRVQFAWSYKTNYLKAICNVFHEEGAIAEVVSDFEYQKARKLGMRGDQIIVNGPYKPRGFLMEAVHDHAKIQIDNHQEIRVLEEVAQAQGRVVDVAIRVNMETSSDIPWSKFGFNYESGEATLAIKRICASEHLRLVGLHAHIGTFILDPTQYQVAIGKLVTLLWTARQQFGVVLEYLNMGGGFASCNTLHYQYLPGKEVSPSFQQYAEAICTSLLRDLPADMDQPPTLYLETGRALVDEAGYLVTSVIDSRRMVTGRQAIVVDAGINLLYTVAWYKLDIQPVHGIHAPVESTRVYGPLCMNIDVLREDASLPPLSPGDRLMIHPVGAYTITQSMQFITYRPAVVMVGCDGRAHVIRRRENLEYVEALEQLPDHAEAAVAEKPVTSRAARKKGSGGLVKSNHD